MQPIVVVVAFGVIAVLALDTIGSFASLYFGFNYGSLSAVSWILRIGTGFFAARYGSITLGALAGGVVAFIDSTLGWYISWIIGPGRPKGGLTTKSIGRIIAKVTLTGAALGFVGGFLAR